MSSSGSSMSAETIEAKYRRVIEIFAPEMEEQLVSMDQCLTRSLSAAAGPGGVGPEPTGVPAAPPGQSAVARLVALLPLAKAIARRTTDVESAYHVLATKASKADWLCKELASKVSELKQELREERDRRRAFEDERAQSSASKEREKQELLKLLALTDGGATAAAAASSSNRTESQQTTPTTSPRLLLVVPAPNAATPPSMQRSYSVDEGDASYNNADERERTLSMIERAESMINALLSQRCGGSDQSVPANPTASCGPSSSGAPAASAAVPTAPPAMQGRIRSFTSWDAGSTTGPGQSSQHLQVTGVPAHSSSAIEVRKGAASTRPMTPVRKVQ